ncbi:MAG: Co2+/Mg2+ efflux protein ApaG [Flavobacteriaceae bacterium]|nr:Co2+/Mg2+ efflux protein ApaG [Flavobacteriaceae bacterium]
MTCNITNGIKISVEASYNGVIQKATDVLHFFSYKITITNTSNFTVQLLSRFWEITDTLNNKEFVEGKGVIGKTPIITPNQTFSYQSNCFLLGETGTMKGYYTMLDKKANSLFKVYIPTFQLTSSTLLN